jgi:UDP-N-acetylmuramoyl-tripeptide--D-alanyl-D-alanine ligase
MEFLARMTRPDVVVVTSIGTEHMRSFGTLDATRQEKSLMVRALPDSGTAVLNGDDPNVMWMAGRTRARVVTYGLGLSNDVRASEVKLDWPRGTRFRLHAGGMEREVRVRLLGRQMVYPVLAAAAAALSEGLALDEALERLASLAPASGRLEPLAIGDGAYVLRDEYKSSLETIHTALDVFSEVPAERRIVVFGEVSEPPGSQGPIYRKIGRRVADIASHAVFICSSNSFQRYAAGAVRGGMERTALIHVKGGAGSVPGAVEAVRKIIGPGDVVLVKGRNPERLARVSLALAGRRVRCEVIRCKMEVVGCAECPMLELGWDGLPSVQYRHIRA